MDLNNFASHPPRKTAKPVKAPNGPLLPDTTGEQWHYIENVNYDNGRLTFVHKYESDAASIAMRPPFTPWYLDAYQQTLQNREHVQVHRINGSMGTVIQVGGETEESLQKNPCLLIYAREHADEHDGSWVAQGAVEYMLLDLPEGQRLRRSLTLLVIPLFDAEGGRQSNYNRIVNSFKEFETVPESNGYAEFFRKWFNEGRRIDLVINLHNVESSEAPHISCGSISYNSKIHKMGDWMQQFHVLVHARMQSEGYQSAKNIWGPNDYFFRLTGFLRAHMGSTWVLYEVNSQAPQRHLTLGQTRYLGAVLLEAARDYLRSPEAGPLLAHAKERREFRLRQWLYYNNHFYYHDPIKDAVHAERQFCHRMYPADRSPDNPYYKQYVELLRTSYPHLLYLEEPAGRKTRP